MRASIVIPSYNSKERLYLNLVSLNNQSYPGEDVEVIVVDNGSSDDTMSMLQDFRFKYPSKIIRIEKNRGIAYGRNEGIKQAIGEILFFHDSDMLASPDYIEKHLLAHDEKNLVVCGVPWKRVFSFYYKEFSKDQLRNLHNMLREKKMRSKDFSDSWPNAYPFICEDTVKRFLYREQVFDLDIGFIRELKSLLNQYGTSLTDYYLPWRFFITNNLSVDRSAVLDVGMLDTKIVKYGYEDYDLGVRLYQSGCKFKLRYDIISIHQEHPHNFNYLDLMDNLNYICEKYNNIQSIALIMICINGGLQWEPDEINDITKEINEILDLKQYDTIVEMFLKLLQLKRKRLFLPDAVDSISVFDAVARNLPVIVRQAIDLRHPYSCFTERFGGLLYELLGIDFHSLIAANMR